MSPTVLVANPGFFARGGTYVTRAETNVKKRGPGVHPEKGTWGSSRKGDLGVIQKRGPGGHPEKGTWGHPERGPGGHPEKGTWGSSSRKGDLGVILQNILKLYCKIVMVFALGQKSHGHECPLPPKQSYEHRQRKDREERVSLLCKKIFSLATSVCACIVIL